MDNYLMYHISMSKSCFVLFKAAPFTFYRYFRIMNPYGLWSEIIMRRKRRHNNFIQQTFGFPCYNCFHDQLTLSKHYKLVEILNYFAIHICQSTLYYYNKLNQTFGFFFHFSLFLSVISKALST